MTQEVEPKKRRSPVVWILAAAAVLVFLVVVCVIVAALSDSTDEGTAAATPQETQPTTEAAVPTETSAVPEPTPTVQATDTPPATSTPEPTDTPNPTTTPEPTDTLGPTDTPEPTNTPIPPTATPDQNVIQPGTYLVGTDIRPGIYRGQGGYDLLGSCYWARLSDLSGSLESILANDNSIGQFYIQVKDSDRALETACRLTLLDPLPGPPADFPQSILPGTYLVGIDISPGTYRGQAGDDVMDSCYWARLKDVGGELDSILANDNANGQYYIEVQPGDFALSTACDLERMGD